MDYIITTVETIIGISLIIVFYIIMSGFTLINDNEIGISTKKMHGHLLQNGNIISPNGEIGIQADTLSPGLYWTFALFWNIKKCELTTVMPGYVGIVFAVDGHYFRPNQRLGDSIYCNAYQDGRQFLINGGQRGLQADLLYPGTYRINTQLFLVKCERSDATEVPDISEFNPPRTINRHIESISTSKTVVGMYIDKANITDRFSDLDHE